MIHFTCPNCGRAFNVPASYAGKQARCACKTMLLVPTPAPVVRPVQQVEAPKPLATGLRGRRLIADEHEIRQTFGSGSLVRIVSVEGSPPQKYVLDIAVRSLVAGSERGQPSAGDVHRVEVAFTNDYPRVAPRCRMLTPAFHPNFDANASCVGDHWAAGERVSDLVMRIAEILAYQAYNIRSPLNAVAAMWADLNATKLPIDARDLRSLVSK